MTVKETDEVTACIYDLNSLNQYKFVVIFARYQDKWLYSRHKLRTTWETAGGHVEDGETPLEAAKRELYEETGATQFDIKGVFDYSVFDSHSSTDGQVFLADIKELGDIPEEELWMCEVSLHDTYPSELTYPDILPVLFEEVKNLI